MLAWTQSFGCWILNIFFILNSPCRGKWSRKNRGQQVHHAIHCCHHQPQSAGWGGKVSEQLLLTLLHHITPGLVYWQWEVMSEFCLKTDSQTSCLGVYDHANDCAFTVLHLLCSPRSALDVFPCIQTVPQQFYVDTTTVDSHLLSFHFIVLLQLLLKSKFTVRYRVGVEPSVVLHKGHVGHGTIKRV